MGKSGKMVAKLNGILGCVFRIWERVFCIFGCVFGIWDRVFLTLKHLIVFCEILAFSEIS